MTQDNEALVQRILQLSEDIFNVIPITIPVEWLSSDLTLAQLRALVVLHIQGDSRMSDIASALEIVLPTATNIVDKLVNKGLVKREADVHDRRLVLCRLSSDGKDLVNKLWRSGQFQMEILLEGLTPDQLRKAADVAQILFDNLSRKIGNVSGVETQ